MAKGKFYAMKLGFALNSQVRALYNLPNEKLSALIFQYDLRDADAKREQFTLIAYPVDKAGKVIEIGGEPVQITLIPDYTVSFPQKKKQAFFGNLPYSRAQLGYFIGGDSTGLIKHLYFNPIEYLVKSDEYVAYEVSPLFTLIPKDKLLAGDDLKPSPPAIPPSFL